MVLTYRDVLRHIPADRVLERFFTDSGFSFSGPVEFDGELDNNVALQITEEIENCSDMVLRDRVVSGLQQTLELNAGNADKAMFDSVRGDDAARAALGVCVSSLHRALWLMVHSPPAFINACEMYYLDSHESRSQQADLGVCSPVIRTQEALQGFQSAIQHFYRKELSCGEAIEANILDRSPSVYLVVAHAKDLATVSREFQGSELHSRVANPSIDMAIEYSALTGVARTLIKGGAKYHTMLASAFARHLLGQKAEPRRLPPPTINLGALRTGFHAQQAYDDGFCGLQVKSISLLSPDDTLKTEFTATGRRYGESVIDLINRHLPHDSPLEHQWKIEAASIKLHYPPGEAHGGRRVVTVEITSTGRLNLHKYDEALRNQLEGYLLEAGIMQPGQALDMHEIDAAQRPDLNDADE